MVESDIAGAADAFGVVANETRVRIIHALARPQNNYAADARSYTELREAVGIRDSGHFNYHLKQLVGQFVAEAGDEYTLTMAGVVLYRATVSGFLDGPAETNSWTTSSHCPACGDRCVAEYRDSVVWIDCPTCERKLVSGPFPPRAVEALDREAVLRAFDRFTRATNATLVDGVCPWCAGPVPPTVERYTNPAVLQDREERVLVTRRCEHCYSLRVLTVGDHLLFDPAVVAFYHRHGVDVTATPHWELDFVTTEEPATVVSEDPWEFEVTLTADGDRLDLVVDEEMTITEATD